MISPLVVIAGPTATGKSRLALDIAHRFNGEIVNCDSLQLYKYLNTGTAKSTPAEREGIPHHLLDVLNPDQIFTAGDYARLARPVLREIAGRGKLPVVAGGTGFYLRALLEGLFQGPSRDVSLRARLAKRSSGSLHKILLRFDRTSALRIHPNDKQKLIRAVEVCLLARRPMSELFSPGSEPLDGFRILKLGLDPPRQELYRRIQRRTAEMFQRGLIEELRGILRMGFPADSKALECIGYREALLHIQGDVELEEAIRLAAQNTQRYAKRQWTWFRREPGMIWLSGFGDSEETKQEAFGHVEKLKKIVEKNDGRDGTIRQFARK